MNRRKALSLVSAFSVAGATTARSSARTHGSTDDEHSVWVEGVLKRMLAVKPGMERAALLKVFTTEGGLSAPQQRTYVSRDCPYFKVNVTFRLLERAGADRKGSPFLEEDPKDVIATISQPYLDCQGLD